jgi:hypothetical protein
LGSELNIYDLGDVNLVFDLIVYPSITESGRWRSDITFDIKYDLPFDFFIKLGTTLNYDNHSAQWFWLAVVISHLQLMNFTRKRKGS